VYVVLCIFIPFYPNLTANISARKKNVTMTLYMDIHHKVEGLTAEAVTHAHARDLEVQEKHGVKYLHYWYDEGTGKVFCLCEAPSKAAAEAVHREAHGGSLTRSLRSRKARNGESGHLVQPGTGMTVA